MKLLVEGIQNFELEFFKNTKMSQGQGQNVKTYSRIIATDNPIKPYQFRTSSYFEFHATAFRGLDLGP